MGSYTAQELLWVMCRELPNRNSQKQEQNIPYLSEQFMLLVDCYVSLFLSQLSKHILQKQNEHKVIPAAAAAAKSLQSCLTLCDPMDSSPPGSPIPGILQARTLEWVAISFSNA